MVSACGIHLALSPAARRQCLLSACCSCPSPRSGHRRFRKAGQSSATAWMLTGWIQPYVGTCLMMCQVFPVPPAFNPQQRRHWRAEMYLSASRSRSEVDGQCARTSRRSQYNDQFWAPNPSARSDKIAQLRHAVENGDYCVSPEQIAEKMVQEVLVALFT
jgi:anti-sigma28 factor (negative regulator of flagellin synthesis)